MKRASLESLRRENKKFLKVLGELEKSLEAWNVKGAEKKFKEGEEIWEKIRFFWDKSREEGQQELAKARDAILKPDYQQRLESELKKKGFSWSGKFPEYSIPPLKVVIDAANGETRIFYGRKRQVVYSLEPVFLVGEIFKYWNRITGTRFNEDQFLQSLLNAYKYVNREVYREEEVLWGRAVPLESIYNILTLHRNFRQEYTKEQFMFDIGRIRKKFGAGVDGYRLEFGYARNQEQAMVVIDSQGREHRLSSLNFYKEGEA